ncbi:MAG TPA: hypothetical protein VHC73_01355 [Vitreimonas sp.]|nr:hypothetical protein [Vitreimonas sp.]
MLAAFILMATIAVACAYGTTGLAQRTLASRGNAYVAAAVSLICWWSADCLLSFGLAPLLGPNAQIDLIDLRDFGVAPSLMGKFGQYAVAHAVAVLPRLPHGRPMHA